MPMRRRPLLVSANWCTISPATLNTNQPRPSTMSAATSPIARTTGTVAEVFAIFLRLGCTSFGGPIAHLGYYRAEFVERRRWLDERAFADLVGLAQFLPGPASSQTGFAIRSEEGRV